MSHLCGIFQVFQASVPEWDFSDVLQCLFGRKPHRRDHSVRLNYPLAFAALIAGPEAAPARPLRAFEFPGSTKASDHNSSRGPGHLTENNRWMILLGRDAPGGARHDRPEIEAATTFTRGVLFLLRFYSGILKSWNDAGRDGAFLILCVDSG